MTEDFDEEYYLAANPDVVLAVKSGLVKTGWDHYIRFGRSEGRPATSPDNVRFARDRKPHRGKALEFLTGNGIELGACHSPCPMPVGSTVTYCDRFDPEEAKKLWSELANAELVGVDKKLDVNSEGLSAFEAESLDFAIFNNGLQQVANPIAVVEELFRVTKPGGHVVVSVPDKRFTFEASRTVTPWDHLLDEYLRKVTEVSDAHYVDLLSIYAPTFLLMGVAVIDSKLRDFRRRCEHAHVWDTEGFRDFARRAQRVSDVSAELVLEVTGEETMSEYFAIYRKKRQML